jgi:hypothetical protein
VSTVAESEAAETLERVMVISHSVIGSETAEAAASRALLEELSSLQLVPLRCLYSGSLPNSGGERQAPVNIKISVLQKNQTKICIDGACRHTISSWQKFDVIRNLCTMQRKGEINTLRYPK